MIGIEHVPDPSGVNVLEDGLILPIPTERHDTVILEPRDGGNIQTLTARGVRMEKNGVTVFRCTKVRINVMITDARVALACSKYDKGGGWIGTLGAMAVLNAASKGLAAIRRHGKMMVGQVRYPWINGVGSTAHQGMGSEERLVFECKPDQANTLRLTLLLPKDLEGAAMAAEVVRRAARYRLESDPNLAVDKRDVFVALTTAQRLPTGAKNIIQFHRMPSFYSINHHSARMAPSGAMRAPTPAVPAQPASSARPELPVPALRPAVPPAIPATAFGGVPLVTAPAMASPVPNRATPPAGGSSSVWTTCEASEAGGGAQG